MKLSAPIFRLKNQARSLSRATKAPLHAALDAIATREGFRNWGHLSASSARELSAADLLSEFVAGDLVLIGARAGQGKTLLAMDLAIEAARANRGAYIYSLEETERRIAARLEARGARSERVAVDTSDEISAPYIVHRLRDAAPGSFVVIDYLQILDQKRDTPPLGAQLALLADFARSRGMTIAIIAQIDRRFEENDRVMPDVSDLRLPNPVDGGLFTKCCFLHDGAIMVR